MAIQRKPTLRSVAERNALAQANVGLVHARVAQMVAVCRELATCREDMTQEAMLGLLRAAELREPEKSTFGYYSRYWIDDKIRRYIKSRHDDGSMEYDERQHGEWLERRYDGDSDHEYRTIQRVAYAVADLPDKLRRVVHEWFFQERTPTAIANRLGVSRPGVYELRNQAFRELRRQLEVIHA